MGGDLGEWIHLLLRWLHVVAGAFWIGQTSLFSWLDARSGPRAAAQRAVGDAAAAGRAEADAWMIHSGGFYRVERISAPTGVPAGLKWFKWEAAASWVSGFLLLNLVYYHGGIMVEPGSRPGTIAASAIGVVTLVLGWALYDGLWRTALERRERAGAAISLVLLAVAAWGLTEVMTGRAAYIHVGALFGTIMAANVWSRILPAQRRMVRAIERGEPYDPALAARAKQRSKHNSYLTIPLVFLMVSAHFPTTSYGHRLNWALLWVFLLGGFAARAALNAADRRG
jgi:uncharacterized membrane protein